MVFEMVWGSVSGGFETLGAAVPTDAAHCLLIDLFVASYSSGMWEFRGSRLHICHRKVSMISEKLVLRIPMS